MVGGATERALNGQDPANPKASAADALAGGIGGAGEKSMEGLLPEVGTGSSIERGALGSFTDTSRTETQAAVENTLRTAVRTTTAHAAKEAVPKVETPASPPPPQPKPAAPACPSNDKPCH